MITLIGHGYVGRHIQMQLEKHEKKYNWISHDQQIPKKTTVVINAAGYTGFPNVDACEIRKQETIDGNVMFPVKLENHCPDLPIVHISSGCVYTGYKDGGWTEDDEPNFDFSNGSFYSGSKALAQKLLMPYMEKSYLLRIRMPFGDYPDPKNLFTKLEKYDKLVDFENSLSYTNDVARAAIFFAEELPESGIYNVCNPGSMTTKQIAEKIGVTKEWFTEEEFLSSVKAPRSNCVLNTDKLQRIFSLTPVERAVDIALKEYRK